MAVNSGSFYFSFILSHLTTELQRLTACSLLLMTVYADAAAVGTNKVFQNNLAYFRAFGIALDLGQSTITIVSQAQAKKTFTKFLNVLTSTNFIKL